MSHPQRLKDETRDPIVKALLASADVDRPDAGALDRAKRALGVLDPPPPRGPATAAGSLGALGWVGLGILGAAVIWGSMALAPRGSRAIRDPGAEDSMSEMAAPARSETASSGVVASDTGGSGTAASGSAAPEVPAATVPSAAALPPAGAEPDPTQARGPSREPRAGARTTAVRSASLLEQMALVDAARAALAAHEPPRALSILDDLQRRFPNGALDEEATVVRIEALRAAGEHARAQTLARTFLDAHPGSTYARRVRSGLKEPF
ncbi:hypothetical protein [Pendulispora albinea]|uniref:Outer membrane lipoprotein BamD-like domain-containing protein n=1 Tax=Pendulispora albinea TaxID=2741071 RepID=A0ABZ2MBF2_9BACT